MVITRTPFRVSLFGGGTDYPSWFARHGGEVLVTSINKYCYISARYLPPFFEHRTRLVYSRTELCQTVDEIQHPAIREVLRYLGIERGVEIHHDGDLPARSGLGSSSAFTVGLLHALYALRGTLCSREQLAREAIHLERDVLQETVGSQDQIAAAYGGFNRVVFLPDGNFDVHPVTIPGERIAALNAQLMLFYTRIPRVASNVAGSYAHDLQAREAQMRTISDLVRRAVAILTEGADVRAFGELLHEGWEAKQALSSQVTNPEIQAWYEAARAEGAIGGKLIGAGGGGFMLLFADPGDHPRIRQRLAELLYVPFQFEHSGSQVIFYDPQEDYEAAAAALAAGGPA